MKIRKYYIKNQIVAILTLSIMYSLLGYMFFVSKQYLGLFLLIICSVELLNRRIVLYEDKIKVIQGYKRIEIEFDSIESLKIDSYKPKLSNISIPAIYAKMKDRNIKIFYYSSYSRESISEIINCAIKKNNVIKLDSNIRAIINNEESEYEIKRKSDGKLNLILMIVVVILIMIYAKFRK